MYIAVCNKDQFEIKLDSIRHYYNPRLDTNIDKVDDQLYSELSALYWLWKHNNDDIIGLEHYRRFFVSKDSDVWNHEKAKKIELVNENEINELLQTKDIILCEQEVPAKNALTFLFSTRHNSVDSDSTMYDMFINWFEYLAKSNNKNFYFYMIREMSKSPTLYANNMLIGKREVISSYCNWLFPTLSDFKSRYYPAKMVQRGFGYLAEWSMGYWFKFNKIAITSLYKVVYDDDAKPTRCCFTHEELTNSKNDVYVNKILDKISRDFKETLSKNMHFDKNGVNIQITERTGDVLMIAHYLRFGFNVYYIGKNNNEFIKKLVELYNDDNYARIVLGHVPPLEHCLYTETLLISDLAQGISALKDHKEGIKATAKAIDLDHRSIIDTVVYLK